jgi:hypothetical protein
MKISELENAPEWLKRAEVINEDVVMDGEHVVWLNGEWIDGIWEGGTWEDGIWYNGTWLDGVWYKGEWHGGEWCRGSWGRGWIMSCNHP